MTRSIRAPSPRRRKATCSASRRSPFPSLAGRASISTARSASRCRSSSASSARRSASRCCSTSTWPMCRRPSCVPAGWRGRVLGALGAVPRHLFVEEALPSRAYEDTALPIGFGQTISQPYVVARMIEALIEQKIAKKILEVGTGCGYQAAVLASIFREVYSIERIKGLLERARENLLGLRLRNLRLAHGDGYAGLDRAAPFQSIIVAAAARQIPDALL